MGRRSSAPKSDVPFLHAKQIEREAGLLLEEYALKFPAVTAPPVPVDGIAELHLQLSLEYLDMKSLFPMADVHGAIWFQQARIGIDQSLDPDANPSRRGRYHFTLAHEVGHWRLHRQHFVSNPAHRAYPGDEVQAVGRSHRAPVVGRARRPADRRVGPVAVAVRHARRHPGRSDPGAVRPRQKDLRHHALHGDPSGRHGGQHSLSRPAPGMERRADQDGLCLPCRREEVAALRRAAG